MKKLLALLFALILVFSFTSCEDPQADGGGDKLPNKTPEELIAEGDYLNAYKVLLAKGDEASKAELEKFVSAEGIILGNTAPVGVYHFLSAPLLFPRFHL